MTARISDLTAADLGRMYADGSLSPVEVARASLENAERHRRLNVFVRPPDGEQILAQARQSEARWRTKSARGRLDGVPITVKRCDLGERAADVGRIEACRSEPGLGGGCARGCKIAGRRGNHPGQDNDAGIRLEGRDGFAIDGHIPESVGSGTHAGGLERRLSRCRSGGDWSRRHRNGCRRLGSHSRLLLRPRCAQSIARTHSHLSAKSARHDGSCWSDLPHNPGHELVACSHIASRPPRLERPAAGRCI